MDQLAFCFVCTTFMAFTLGEQSISPCNSPQYLGFGRPGTINCDFGEDFLGVYWYNSTTLLDSDQIIYYSDYKKDGTGYLSGEFDILPNGTLIINNVSLHHEHVFTVVMFRTKVETTVPIYVMVSVTVKPTQRFPTIDQCGEERVCLREIYQPAMLYCYVNDSRPAVNLTFAIRTAYDDHGLTSMSMFQQRQYLHTATIAVHLSMKSIVKFYVCKADEPPTLMENNHSAILVQSRRGVDVAEPVNIFVEKGDTVQLNCSFSPMLYVIWLKREPEEVDHNIAYRIMWKDYQINHTNARYSLEDENSLMIHHVTVQDEGVYGCVTGDGMQEEVKAFNITVSVKPSPEQVTVDGCIENRNCLLLVERTGILTCRLHNIRPIVSLQCRFVDNLSQNKFQKGNLTYKTSPDRSSYDVTYSSEYHIDDESSDKVTVECFVERNITLLLKWPDLTTELDLRVLKDKHESFSVINVFLLVYTLIPVLLLILVKVRQTCSRINNTRTKKNDGPGDKDEEELLMDPVYLADKLATLKNELKKRYREVCQTMKPLPNSKRSYCIDELFIDGGLKLMSHNARGEEKWFELSSYHSVVGDNNEKYDRVIIQGDSGFGKTLLCRKMAYDWCTENQSSPFGKVNILIYLHVRMLAKSSLSEAIRHHLLPSDTTLRNEDIKGLLSQASSIIVLDGYNRVPASRSYESSELNLILMNRAFQNSQVFLTALTNFLPQPYALNTKKIKLVGFSDKIRDDYIRERLARNEPKAQQLIKSFFKSNPEIHKFCHVPLLFVLLSNLRYQGAISTKNDVTKVTEIVQFIILALQNQEEANDRSGQTSRDTTVIDSKLAFEAFDVLINPETGFRLNKENLQRKIGNTLYEKYIGMGLLIEEHVFHSRCSTRRYQNVNKHKTEVKFYHSTFLEWYAAQELSRVAEHSIERKLWTILDKVNPLNHQYVFRFACGLNQKAAVKIVNYLEEKGDDYRKFAQVCIVEQKGGFDKVRKTVQKLCSKPVIIEDDDGVLYQRSVVQLLEIASKNKIRIEVLWLQEIPVSFSSTHQVLQFASEIQLPTLETLQELFISLSTQLTEVEFAHILEYVSLCKQLMRFRLRGCLLPIETHCKALQVLDERHVSVEWLLPLSEMSRYRLNLQTGYWEDRGKRLTDDMYGIIKTFLGFDEVPHVPQVLKEVIVTIE